MKEELICLDDEIRDFISSVQNEDKRHKKAISDLINNQMENHCASNRFRLSMEVLAVVREFRWQRHRQTKGCPV